MKIQIFPSFCTPASASTIRIHFHLRVTQPTPTLFQQAFVRLGEKALFRGRTIDRELFEERTQPFLSNGIRNVRLYLHEFGDTPAGISNGLGEIFGSLEVNRTHMKRRICELSGVLEGNNICEPVHLTSRYIGRSGISIISDIDDTVKVSSVSDKRALLRNALAEKYHAVPKMSEIYRAWEEQGAQFHYTSTTPWQLLEPVQTFLGESNFPHGTLHLKRLQLDPWRVSRLLAKPEHVKGPIIERLIRLHHERKFVLIGDNSEQDEQIYLNIASRFPERIVKVFIRRVLPEKARRNSPVLRYFTKAEELPLSLRSLLIAHDERFSEKDPESMIGIPAFQMG